MPRSPTGDQEAADRRPIASRNTVWARSAASWLHRAGVSPNAISIAGMVAASVVGIAFGLTAHVAHPLDRVLWLCGAVLIQLRLLANLLDGMVAEDSGRASAVGQLFNEIPDRVSDSCVLIGLGFAPGGNPLLGCLAALAAVFTAYVRVQACVAGAPQDYCGPMAKPHRMFFVTLLALYCAVAPPDWKPEGALGGVPTLALAVVFVGTLLTAWRRITRAASALRGRTS